MLNVARYQQHFFNVGQSYLNAHNGDLRKEVLVFRSLPVARFSDPLPYARL